MGPRVGFAWMMDLTNWASQLFAIVHAAGVWDIVTYHALSSLLRRRVKQLLMKLPVEEVISIGSGRIVLIASKFIKMSLGMIYQQHMFYILRERTNPMMALENLLIITADIG